MTSSSYGKIERDHRTVNLTWLAKLSIALGITIEALLERCVVTQDGSFRQSAPTPKAHPFLSRQWRCSPKSTQQNPLALCYNFALWSCKKINQINTEMM